MRRSVVLSDLLLVGAVVSWGGYIAVSKPLIVRHGAMPVLAGTFLAGCLHAPLPFAFLAWPSWPTLQQVSPIRLDGPGVPGAFHHSVRLGLSEPGPAALRRQPGRHIQQCVAGLDGRLGNVALWRSVDAHARRRRAMTLGGIYWACRPRPAVNRTGAASRLEAAFPTGAVRASGIPRRRSCPGQGGGHAMSETAGPSAGWPGRLRDQPRLRPSEPDGRRPEPGAGRRSRSPSSRIANLFRPLARAADPAGRAGAVRLGRGGGQSARRQRRHRRTGDARAGGAGPCRGAGAARR